MFTPSNYHDGWVYQRGAFEQWFDETWTSILARDTADRYLTQSRKDACRGPRLPRNGCVKPSFSNHTKSEKYISAIRATSLRTAGCSDFPGTGTASTTAHISPFSYRSSSGERGFPKILNSGHRRASRLTDQPRKADGPLALHSCRL